MNIETVADQYVKKAKMAAAVFEQFTQEDVDRITDKVHEAGFNKRVELAKMAVEETGLGVWQHKVLKNVVATQLVYEQMKEQKTVGVVSHDEVTGITEVAQPFGPILAVIPTTNPTSTVLFKILICLKSRNPIIISPHPRAAKCCIEAARICYETALAAGAPEDCIQIISEPSLELTQALMHHHQLGLILATGGPGLVKAAYSSGNPAIGVGPGNVPVLIEKTTDPAFAVENILISKTFDNGTICASEQSIIVEKEIADAVVNEFEKQNGYFLTPDEVKKLEKVALNPETGGMSPKVVGQSVAVIAEMAGISVPEGARLLLVRAEKAGKEEPLSCEILAPILTFYVKDNFKEAVKHCIDLNHSGGLGHTASIYSNDDEKIMEFCNMMDAGRVVINTPSSQGGVGGIFNMLTTSLTLGCGAGGNNITSENITAKDLINIKRCAHRRDNEKFCKFPVEKYCDEKLDLRVILDEYNRNF